MYVPHVHIQWARLYVCVHVNISTEMFRSIFRYECTNACLRVHRHMMKSQYVPRISTNDSASL